MQTMNNSGFTWHAATVAALVRKNLLMIYKQVGIAKSASIETLLTNTGVGCSSPFCSEAVFSRGTRRHNFRDMEIATVKTIKLGEAAPWKSRFRKTEGWFSFIQ